MHEHDKRNDRSALILGASGNLGTAVAQALLAQGWRVRALSRHEPPATVSGLERIEWVRGDAMQADDVRRAAQGMGFIVHAVNPPGYRRWRELALPMLENTIQAAHASGARVIFPGNVYNFGPDAGSLLREDAPQHPLTNKGRVRVEMEQRLQEAASRGVRSLVFRAGDFFGGQGPSSWFQQLWSNSGRPLKRVAYPGAHDAGHSWAYLPDVALALARVMDVDRLQPGRLAAFEVLHFKGHWLPRGVAMAEAVRCVLGHPNLPISGVPWAWMRLASPLVPLLREVLEMRYLWDTPLQLDNTRLRSLIGDEPHTPLDQAVRASLRLDTGRLALAQSASAG
jgi:nucleoside-diphosphate-sugar epimerase